MNSAHELHGWRIGEITTGFTLEDVWRMPVEGSADDFDVLIELMTVGDDLMGSAAWPARALWLARGRVGGWLGLGHIDVNDDRVPEPALAIPGSRDTSLTTLLPDDLRGSVEGVYFESVPFHAVYRTDREFAAELSNRTVHAVMHLGWVADGDDRYHGEMAAYAKPRGLFGEMYMAFIKPFRRLIVYPALFQQIEGAWRLRTSRANHVSTDRATDRER